MKKIIIISTLLLTVLASQAQLAIIYRGDFGDGFATDSDNSFTPNYTLVANHQYPYLGNDEDGFAVDALNNFAPNYSMVAIYQNPYLGDDEDGFTIDGLKNFTPNYANLVLSQYMYTGNTSDGFAFDTISYSTPLPVTLLFFDGHALGTKNSLFWKTATEENVSHFALGKGKDGLKFNTIGQVLAKGNSSTEQKYDYTDYTDVAGSNYYRLKIIDKDEQYSYSKVIKLTNDKNNFSILLAPNPASDYLSIKFSEALSSNQAELKVISANGQIIAQDVLTKNTVQHNLDLSQLSVGSYFIVLNIGEEAFLLPFVKR